MRISSKLAAAGAFAAGASAENYLGFNSGATMADRSAKMLADFEAEFTTAQGLVGAPGLFNAVRLYTNIQAYSEDDPIQAFEAAIKTNTSILLGIWTSGTTSIAKEISALKKAVDQYGTDFTDLVIGISIGSEDLYRNSATGVANKAGVGNSPDALVGFIGDYKTAFKGSALANVPVGHVDTWDVWPNSTNKPVLDAIDWVGVDEYPYYENGKGNSIKNAGSLFDSAYDATVAAVGGKPVWVTETGWPATGPDWDEAVASVANAKTYWDEVGCRKLFGKTPTFWYNLRDSNPENTMKFAITQNLSTKPMFNLTCPTTFDTLSSTSSSASGTATATATKTSGSSTGVSSSTATSTSGSDASSSGSSSGSDSGSSSGTGTASSATASTTSPVAGLGAHSMQLISVAPYAGLAIFGAFFAFF